MLTLGDMHPERRNHLFDEAPSTPDGKRQELDDAMGLGGLGSQLGKQTRGWEAREEEEMWR